MPTPATWERATDIGDRIRELRTALELSQSHLGDLYGVRGQQVSDWENGRSFPARSGLARLAQILHVPAEIFAEGGPRPRAVVNERHRRVVRQAQAIRNLVVHGSEADAEALRADLTQVTEDVGQLTSDPEEGPGWMFGDPREEEEQVRTFLRNTERTLRGLVGRPDLFSAEELRLNQLAAIRALQKSAELAGRPVPDWLHRIYNEVIAGTFR